MQSQSTEKGLIAWFARNPVAANLLMIFIIVGGLLTAFSIRKQMFPQYDSNWISVQAVYRARHLKRSRKGSRLRSRNPWKVSKGSNA